MSKAKLRINLYIISAHILSILEDKCDIRWHKSECWLVEKEGEIKCVQLQNTINTLVSIGIIVT